MNIIVTSGLNPRAIVGGNHPPAPIDEVPPTPFEMSEVEIGDLYAEAKNFLDGEPIASQEMADAVSKLIEDLRKAGKQADERRVAENKPFDDGKAEVQARYAPLISDTKTVKGKVPLGIEIAKKALAPWLQKLEDEKRAAAEAARKVSVEAERKAQEALAAARAADTLAGREVAEVLLQEAKQADATATKAENSKAHATGGTRAIGLRSVWRAEMVDASAFAKYVWLDHRPELTEFLETLASKLVLGGKRSLPGVNVIEDRVL